MAKTGKAWVMAGPGQLEMKEFPYPKCEKDGIIIKVEACGICGTDKHMFNGNAGMVDFPIIPGHEFAGTIEEIGEDYKKSMLIVDETLDLKVGDRVILGPGTKGCGKCPTCLKYPDKPLHARAPIIPGVNDTLENIPELVSRRISWVAIRSISMLCRIPGFSKCRTECLRSWPLWRSRYALP